MDDNIQLAAVKTVFDQDLLREMILDYAIHPTTDTICRQTLCSVRLVHHTWLQSTSAICRHNKEPLYKLVLNATNSVNGTPFVKAQGKLLDQFVKFVKNGNETFSLKLEEDFFRQENYDSLNSCLRQANQGLVELNMQIPYNGGTLPCIFPNLKLPVLQKLNLTFTPTVLSNLGRYEGKFWQATNSTFLLQSVLNANDSLKTLTLHYASDRFNGVPPGIQYLVLPRTLTKLDMECQLSEQELELLVKNQLPNLEYLGIMATNKVLPDGLMYRVFSNFRKTLKTLRIKGVKPTRPPVVTTEIQFPVMEKLTRLSVISMYTALDPRILSGLNQCFPKLRKLECALHTPEMFSQWIDKSKFETMTAITIQIVSIEDMFAARRFCVLPTVEVMKQIKVAMPNVTEMSLLIDAKDTMKLKELIGEMVHLTMLRVCLLNSKWMENSDLWDSLLTGIPEEVVAKLRENPGDREKFEFELGDELCFRMFKNLKVLALESASVGYVGGAFNDNLIEPLISDLAFKYGLAKMPLRRLCLSGRFKLSDNAMLQWKAQGRSLIYTNGSVKTPPSSA